MTKKLLLRPEHFTPSFPEWKIDGVLNPSAVRLPNEKVVLFVRVMESPFAHTDDTLHCPVIISKEEYKATSEAVGKGEIATRDRNVIYLRNGTCRLMNISHFRKVVLSKDGFEIEHISNSPDFTGTPDDGDYGIEDPRIVKIGKRYVMTYVSVSRKEGVSSSLAISNDLKKWERKGVIFQEQNKDAVIFPEKIGGMYVALNRPEVFYEFHRPAIWISYSPDLIYWGREKSLLLPRGKSWESERLGAGPPPLKTDKGWLLLYHGVKKTKNAFDGGDIYTYSVGGTLLDIKNPERVIARSSKRRPLFSAIKEYERMLGENKRVVFPTGMIYDIDKRYLLIYSGAGDRFVSVQRILLKDILSQLERC